VRQRAFDHAADCVRRTAMRIKSTLSITESNDRVELVLKVLTGLLITMAATIVLMYAATSLEIVRDNIALFDFPID
jgi:hypothetical protein